MGYRYYYNVEDKCVSIHKDYTIELQTQDKLQIVRTKKKNIQLTHSAYDFPSIKGADVEKQLSNIRHIGFEVTDGCNLSCKYCAYGKYYNDYDERENRKIDFDKSKIFLDYLLDKLSLDRNTNILNDIYISFYGGEPLLNFDFIKKIVLYTKQIQGSSLKFHYMMTTNAVLLNNYIDFIVDNDFMLTISLDGNYLHDAYRKFPNGLDSYSLVYNNVKYIQSKYPDYFAQKVGFNSVIHNLNNEEEVFSFIYKEFGKIPNLSGVSLSGVNVDYKDEFENLIKKKDTVDNSMGLSNIKKILDLEYDSNKILQRFIFNYSGNLFDDYNYLLYGVPFDRLPTGTCFPFSKRIFMTVNNKILPCERIGHQYALGVIKDAGVSIDCDSIAEKYNNYYRRLIGQCGNCAFFFHCSKCMFSIDNLDSNPVCENRSDYMKFDEYLEYNMGLLSENPMLYKRIMTEILIAN